mgnify:CR=1 FL=1
MKNTNPNPRNKRGALACAIALMLAPGLAAAAGGDKPAMTAAEKDAYREGQIWATYVTNPGLDALDLHVDVDGDTAILTGTVENAIQKRLAARIADQTEGVTRVDNRILVDPKLVVTVVDTTPGFANAVADATLEAMVDSKLLWNQYTDGLDITVDAEGGVVTLSGIADTPRSRLLAGHLAATTPGTVLVNNRLTLDPDQKGQVATARAADDDNELDDAWVTARTTSALLWTRGVEGTDIKVSAEDGLVTLEGPVESGFERELAIEIAQGIRGVTRVDASGLVIENEADSVSQR